MKLTMDDIFEKLKKGEKVDVECKAAESTVPKSAYESYSAFANTNGGFIFLGIKENRKKKAFSERFEIQGNTFALYVKIQRVDGLVVEFGRKNDRLTPAEPSAVSVYAVIYVSTRMREAI